MPHRDVPQEGKGELVQNASTFHAQTKRQSQPHPTQGARVFQRPSLRWEPALPGGYVLRAGPARPRERFWLPCGEREAERLQQREPSARIFIAASGEPPPRAAVAALQAIAGEELG